MKKKIYHIITQTAKQLMRLCKDPEVAEQEAWWLLEHLLKKKKSALLLEKEVIFTDKQTIQLTSWIAQRVVEKKPLQYIIGFVPFCGLSIITKPPVLIPRPETEEWCNWLIKLLTSKSVQNNTTNLHILDLCCGTGCIAFALANTLRTSNVIGVDIAPEAIAVAEENKQQLAIENVSFLVSDLYQALSGQEHQFDLIVANPPYLSESEWNDLSDEVRQWENPQALVANKDGLALINDIIAQTQKFLRINKTFKKHDIPQFVLEIGPEQTNSVVTYLEQAHFTNIIVHQDMTGKNRWISAAL